MPGWPRLTLPDPKRPRGLLGPVAVFLLALIQPAPWIGVPMAHAQELQVEATSVEHDKEKGIYRYVDARIQAGSLTVNAPKIEIHTAEKRAYASGGLVRFREEGVTGTAERVEIDFDKDTATLLNAKLFDYKSGFYLDAKEMFRPSPGRYIASDCTFTSCSPKKEAWKFYSSELDYRVDGYATTTNTSLWIGPVPAFYFPWFAWPTVKSRSSGFLAPGITFQEASLERFNLGTRLKTPFFWAIGVDHDLTISPEYISNRGLASDWDYQYAFWEDQQGGLRIFGIDEVNSRLAADENIPLGVTPEDEFKASRHILDWRHNQGFGDKQRLILTANQSSDGQVRREYLDISEERPHEEYQGAYSAQTAPVAVAIIGEKTSQFTEESIFANGSEHADGIFRPRLLPRVSFNTGGQPFGAIPLGLELTGHVTRFSTERAVSGQVSELRPAVTLPVRLGGSWELRSSLARRFVQYEDVTERVQSGTENTPAIEGFAQNEVEIELRASWARVFPGDGQAGRALKHRITPRLVFFELEDKNQPLSGSFQLAELEAGGAIPEDELKAGVQRPQFVQRLLTLRLDNTWLQRSGAAGEISTVAHFNIIQPYNLLFDDADSVPIGPTPDTNQLETEPGEPLMPMVLDGGFTFGRFNASTELRYHHQLKKITSRRIGLKGAVSPRARMGASLRQNLFSYRTPDNKLHPKSSRLGLNGNLAASSELSFGYRGVVNLLDQEVPLGRRVESTEMYLDFHPGCYSLRVKYIEKLAVTRSLGVAQHYIDEQILITFTLGGLGAIERSF